MRSIVPRGGLKRVERNLQVTLAVFFLFRQSPALDVYLKRVKDELRHRKFAVPGVAQRDELFLGLRLR